MPDPGPPATYTAPRRLRVIIADPDPLARRIIRDTLMRPSVSSRDPRFVVVAEASDGIEAIEMVRHYQPDLLIVELQMPRVDGLSVTRTLTKEGSNTRVVVFSVAHTDDLELQALRAGAVGYVPKSLGVEAAVSAIEAVARGEAVMSREATFALLDRLRREPDVRSGARPVTSRLTPREWEVLDLLAAGSSTSDIAGALFLTPDTVYRHVKNIMRKLGVRTRSQAVAAAHNAEAASAPLPSESPTSAASGGKEAAPTDDQTVSTEPTTADHEAIATAAAFELLRDVEAQWPSEESSVGGATTLTTTRTPQEESSQDLRELVESRLGAIRSRTRESRRHGSRARDVLI
jgi:two-component system nitrate/nitrite response regulator NarL